MNRHSARKGPRSAGRGPGHDPDIPTPGCYRVSLAPGAPSSVVRIWLGHSRDPATGEEMLDRPFHWQCDLNGAPADMLNFWPGRVRERVSREEHDRIVARNATQDDESPFYDPRKPVDLFTAPLPF